MKNTVTAPPAGGAKYSFVGRPDFNRIIRENEGADVIIVSREDRLIVFLFRVGATGCPNSLETACDSVGAYFEWATYHEGSHQFLPEDWVYFSTSDSTDIKNLRSIAQLFVRARTGKHTVEALP